MLAPGRRSTYPTPVPKRVRCLSIPLALAAIVLVTSVSCRSTQSSAEADDRTTYVVGVEGMSCEQNCAPKVKSALESIAGVKSVEVSFEEKRAIVKMAAGHALTREACDESFGNQGYFVSSLEVAAATDGGGEASAPGAAPAPAGD